MKRWLVVLARQPLLHFLLLGMLIVAVQALREQAPDRYRIVIGAAQRAMIAGRYAQQYGAAPESGQWPLLLDQFRREEILYREGLALHLDQDDEVIRRRIVQKMEFLQQDLTLAAAPDAAQLEAFYRRHAARYRVPEKITFSHVYFAPDRGGDAAAHLRAEQALALLRGRSAARAPERGDPFPDRYDYAALGAVEIERLFGVSEFSQRAPTAPVGQWCGPWRSGYGWHLLLVQARSPAYLPPLASQRARVEADYQRAARTAANARRFAELERKYRVVNEGADD